MYNSIIYCMHAYTVYYHKLLFLLAKFSKSSTGPSMSH